jgi:uridylate kinase
VAVASKGGDRVTGDHMGMLATVINSLALRTSLVKLGVDAVVLSAIAMPELCESFSQRQATAYMNAGKVVIFAGGTGNPFSRPIPPRAARRRNRRGRPVQGHAGRRHLFGRPEEGSRMRPATTRITHKEVLDQGLCGDGHRRNCPCAREQHSDNRLSRFTKKVDSARSCGAGRCTIVADA